MNTQTEQHTTTDYDRPRLEVTLQRHDLEDLESWRSHAQDAAITILEYAQGAHGDPAEHVDELRRIAGEAISELQHQRYSLDRWRKALRPERSEPSGDGPEQPAEPTPRERAAEVRAAAAKKRLAEARQQVDELRFALDNVVGYLEGHHDLTRQAVETCLHASVMYFRDGERHARYFPDRGVAFDEQTLESGAMAAVELGGDVRRAYDVAQAALAKLDGGGGQ